MFSSPLPPFLEWQSHIRENPSAWHNLQPALWQHIGMYETLNAFTILSDWPSAMPQPDPELPLAGLVISVKDNISQAGQPCTAASRILNGYRPPFTATALQRLLDMGAVVVGRTNCDEFGMGSAGENTPYGPIKNAIDPARIAGGSSGGAAVSVQIGACHVALGSDTGGSVRQPAALCGLYGIKPTYGAVSRFGLVAYASSFDQIGLIGTDPLLLAQVLTVMAGADPLDATSRSTPFTQSQIISPPRIAVLSDLNFSTGLHPEIGAALQSCADRFAQTGVAVTECTLPLLPYAIPTYYILTTAEAASNLSRYDGVRYGLREQADNLYDMYTATRTTGFGAEVKRRLLMGNFVLSAGFHDAYFLQALKSRRLIRDAVLTILENADFILLPTTPAPARLLHSTTDPTEDYLADVFTVLANLCGFPAVSFPFGMTRQGLPIGLQLIGRPGSDLQMLRFVDQFKQ